MRIWKAVVLALASAIGVDIAARAFAHARLGHWSVGAALTDTFDLFVLTPIALIAVACSRAAFIAGWRSVRVVLAATLLPLGYLTYHGEYQSRAALIEHKWTASALTGGLAWMVTVVVVVLAAELTLWVLGRSFTPTNDE